MNDGLGLAILVALIWIGCDTYRLRTDIGYLRRLVERKENQR